MAVGVVFLFFQWPSFAAWCAEVGGWRERGGWWFDAFGSAVAGVVLPEIARRLAGDRVRLIWGDLGFRLSYFGLNGVMVAAFYKLQSVWFGDSGAWQVVLVKMLVDQFIYSLFLAVPLAAVAFAWQAAGFRWKPLREDLANGFIFRKIVPVLIPNIAFWFPMVACIYSLPADLQYVFFCCVFAAWSLLLVRLLGKR